MTGRGVTVAQDKPDAAEIERRALDKVGRDLPFPVKIRTTMEPDRDYEVDEAEFTDLSRRGLIAKGGK